MQQVYPAISRESPESQSRAGRYNPCKVARITHKRRKYRAVLSVGDGDEVAYFIDGDYLYVVARRCSLGYAGLTIYDLTDTVPDPIFPKCFAADEVGESFMQSEEQLAETVGPKWEDMSLRTIANRLSEYALA